MPYSLDPTLQTSGVGGGIDISTGTTFGETMAKNASTQALQRQQIEEATEKVKQSKIQTLMKEEEFKTKAFLSAQGLMPKAQAIEMVRLIFKKQGMPPEKIEEMLAETIDKLPEELDGRSLYMFFPALKEIATPKPKEVIALDSDVARGQTDTQGRIVEKGRSYQVLPDPWVEGQEIWRLSGKDEATIATEKRLLHPDKPASSGAEDKGWIDLGKLIQTALRSRSGVVGQVGQTITRADRAINTITRSYAKDGILTKQDLENISTDIAAIYQGGVPGITQIVENSYGTTMTNLVEALRHYTGILAHGGNKTILENTKKKLMAVLSDMRNSGLAQLDQFVEMQMPLYENMIKSDPARWGRMKESVQKFLSSGLINEKGEVLPPTGAPPKAPVQPVSGQTPANPDDPEGILK